MRPGLRNAPDTSHWAVNTTVRCQQHCVYCFEGRREGLSDVPAAQTRRLLDRAAKDVSAVMFMGAEPTANPDLAGLIAYAAKRGLRPGISTNAIRLGDAAFLKKLHDAGLRDIELSFPYPDVKVYSRITGSPPALFSRILKALDNISGLNASLPEPERHFVNVNLVVSAFNVDRLPEVYAHLRRRLPAAGYAITHKRVSMPRGADAAAFLRDIHVPLAVLRRRLPEAARLAPRGTAVAFRDFPLCALPGCEHFDADLGGWLNSVRIRQNFARQDRDEAMYPEKRRSIGHSFDWCCDACSLEPLCRSRQLFRYVPAEPDEAPRPMFGPVPPKLAGWVREQTGGSRGWEYQGPRTSEGWVLRELGRRSQKQGWVPLERGAILMRGARLNLVWDRKARIAFVIEEGAAARALGKYLCRCAPWPKDLPSSEDATAARLPAALGGLLRKLQARGLKAYPDGAEDCLWVEAEGAEGGTARARVFIAKDGGGGECAARVGAFGVSLSAPPPLHGEVVAAVAEAVRSAIGKGGRP